MRKKMNKFFVALGLSLVLGFLVTAQSVVALRDNTPLRSDNGKGGVVWALEVLAGQKLELLDPVPVRMNLVTTSETTPDVEFYRVRHQGKDYFVRASEAAPAAQAAVIVEDAVLFTRPRISDFRNALLEAGSIVVTGNQVSHTGVDFVEVFFFDTAAWQIRSRYVVSPMVSSARGDVEAVQLLQKVAAMKDTEVQQELLHSAMNLNTTMGIKTLVEDFVRQLVPVAFTQEDIMPLELPGNVVIATGDGDNVNVRSFPGTGSESQVVDQLSQGTDVAIVATTARPQVIDGVEAPWYQVRAHLEDGSLVEGWIFGGYLEQ